MHFSQIAFLQPTIETEVEVQPLRVATHPEDFSPAPPTIATGPTQPFGGARQDGRLGAALGDPRAVTWVQRFATPLLPDTRAHSVLQHGDAILVQASRWQLFDRDGALRSDGRGGPGPLVISAADETFRWVNHQGSLVAAALSTGDELWAHGLHHGGGALYPFLAVDGDRSVVVSADRFVDPEAEHPPTPTLAVEVITVGSPVEVSAGGNLRSAASPGALTTASDGDVIGAFGEDVVVVAWRDHLLTLGVDLSVRRVLGGTFEPRALSLGEGGRVYFIARTADGPQLWMLNAAGEQVFAVALPDEAADTQVPPIVSPDHRVFVVTGQRIVAFAPDGEWLWEFVPGGTPHAAVTADGWLLVAVNQSLGVLDGDGRGVSIYAETRGTFRTPPVLTADGEILIATESSLVCLQYEEVGVRTLLR